MYIKKREISDGWNRFFTAWCYFSKEIGIYMNKSEVITIKRIELLVSLRRRTIEFDKKEAPLTKEYQELENVLIKLLKMEATNLVDLG